MADENNTGDEQFTPDGSMEPLSPQEADTTDYGLMDTGERIQRKDLQQEMRESYLAYALSVIVERALPDVRDGMKPVHRRVIYAMYDGGYRPERGYNKCSRVVGDVMGKYHPHGDSAIYDTLVRMAQSWSMRNMLVDGQGNFGSPGDDPAAAMRYTECRMAPLAMEMVRDIDKDTVDFVPNYDGRTQEPTVLPARFPNLLANGSSGIAVGMATSIPPHNLSEVIDAVKAYMLDENITTAELMRYMQGPDFPTGGIVTNKDELLSIYETGAGKIKLRGKVETEKGKNGRTIVVITEIPYTMIGANIGKFLSDVAALAESKKTTDIVDISNQSSKEGIRIVIELKKDADVDHFISMLYKKTRLEDTFGVNMLAISDGRPETLGLKQIIKANTDFQFEINRRKYERLLAKEQEKREIQEGLIKACNVIDLIIEILRGSRDRTMAKACLVDGVTEGIKFKTKQASVMAAQLCFTENQANAILDMRLYKLIGLEIEALIKEHEETIANIYRYEDILERKSAMAQVIINELDALKKEYSQKRRTVIDNCEEVVFEEKKIEEAPAYCLIDRFGYTRCVDVATFERNQEAAFAENRFVFLVKNTGRICLFTNTGQLYTVKVSDLPFGKFRDKAIPLDNVSNFDSTREQLLLAVGQSELNLYRLLFVTKQGMTKMVDGGEFDVMKRTVAAT